jgi:L-fucose dehydrogenase
MDLGLNGAVIAVTGGASGIGEGISRALLNEGARVVVLSRISPSVERFLAEAEGKQIRLHFLEVELGEVEQCRRAMQAIQKQFGRLNGLVNNAGENDGIGLENGTPERFMQSLRHNLLHYYALAQLALPMLKESQGSILNISSKVAVTGQGNTSAYAAAKGAQLALTREWAAELLPYCIRVNAILPAEVMTPLYQRWLDTLGDPTEALHRIQSRIPLEHRMTTAAEIGAAAAFLLSPTQSSHTTGQQLFVDGGYTHLDRALT